MQISEFYQMALLNLTKSGINSIVSKRFRVGLVDEQISTEISEVFEVEHFSPVTTPSFEWEKSERSNLTDSPSLIFDRTSTAEDWQWRRRQLVLDYIVFTLQCQSIHVATEHVFTQLIKREIHHPWQISALVKTTFLTHCTVFLILRLGMACCSHLQTLLLSRFDLLLLWSGGRRRKEAWPSCLLLRGCCRATERSMEKCWEDLVGQNSSVQRCPHLHHRCPDGQVSNCSSLLSYTTVTFFHTEPNRPKGTMIVSISRKCLP